MVTIWLLQVVEYFQVGGGVDRGFNASVDGSEPKLKDRFWLNWQKNQMCCICLLGTTSAYVAILNCASATQHHNLMCVYTEVSSHQFNRTFSNVLRTSAHESHLSFAQGCKLSCLDLWFQVSSTKKTLLKSHSQYLVSTTSVIFFTVLSLWSIALIIALTKIPKKYLWKVD